LTALPHYLYGAGEQALSLTIEHGASFDDQTTSIVMEREKKKTLCRANGKKCGYKCEMSIIMIFLETVFEQCESEEGNFAPQVILFIAQLISGVGGTLYYTLGTAYMDDNIKKSKTPALLSKFKYEFMLNQLIILQFIAEQRFIVLLANARTSYWLYIGIILSETVYFSFVNSNYQKHRSSLVGSMVARMASACMFPLWICYTYR
jgi:hypothetical protein